MRVGLSRMLLISFALHLGLALAALAFVATQHRSIRFPARPVPTAALVYTLRPQAAPRPPAPPASVAQIESHPVNASSLKSVPSAGHLSKYDVMAAAPLQPSALPIHLRTPSDAVLSPTPPPHVNSRDGIVFLLDISGSMYEPDAGSTRLAVARQLLAQRIQTLENGTPFALAVYGESALCSGPLVPANDATRSAAIRFINQEYACGGGTNLPAGLILARQLHAGSILLVTDGDLNAKPNELLPQAREILGAPGAGSALSVIGIRPRPNTDARDLLRTLADQQGGDYQTEPSDTPPALLTKADVTTP